MPNNKKFTDIQPLDYYYAHGYKLMNPLCRVISANPQYIYLLKMSVRNKDRSTGDRMVVKMLTELRNTADAKGWDLLGLDEVTMNAILTGKVEEEIEEWVKNSPADAVRPSTDRFMKSHNKDANKRLAMVTELLIDAKRALAARPSPASAWVIRGDSEGMVSYLKAKGVVFPDGATSTCCQTVEKDWETNQFFSTSEGDTIASLAGHALVWLIRIVPGQTAGRVGGAYISESEVLFPYGIRFRLEGRVAVASEDEIGNLQLNAFADSENLRSKLLKVYQANKVFWKNKPARFLIASEQR